MTSNTIHYEDIDSPVGTLRLVADQQGLREIRFEHERDPGATPPDWVRSHAALAFARIQLGEYFSGKRRHFDLPLHPIGTPFQRTVWAALGDIPYGTTISYGELARRIGKPQAMRAVGAANGRNPLSIVLPCHRVIGADGSLTGYGGGLPIKRHLLALEAQTARGDLFSAKS